MRKPSYQDLVKRIRALESQRKGPGRPRRVPDKMIATGKFTLEILNEKGNVLRRFKNLPLGEFNKYRRDFYKLAVQSLKQKISMNKIVEYRRAE